MIFARKGIDIEYYPSIKEYLFKFKERLTPRNKGEKIGRKPGNYKWYELQDKIDYFDELTKEKIIVRQTSDSIIAALDNKAYLNVSSVQNIFLNPSSNMNYKYVLSILNSKLIDFIYRYLVPETGRVFAQVKAVKLLELPIYIPTHEQQIPLFEKAGQMIKLNKELINELNGFKHWIQKEFNVDKLSKKLEKYYQLSEDEFIDELKKKKVETKSRKNREYLEREFTESLVIIKPLLQEIKQTDNEIDQMVYELYGLTEAEIKLVEGSWGS